MPVSLNSAVRNERSSSTSGPTRAMEGCVLDAAGCSSGKPALADIDGDAKTSKRPASWEA
eukprot:scaffold314033_cov33-Tisochrysis_lutea.AAC.2